MCALARAGGCAIGLFWLFVLSAGQGNAQPDVEQSIDPDHGRELFERVWRSSTTLLGGGGLGPMFNERSCLACHCLGGIGGAGPNQNNVDILSASPPQESNAVGPWLENLREIHPGFARGTSIVLHRFSTSADYPEFREHVLGLTASGSNARHGVTLVLSQRNTTAMFGAGEIDEIPDYVIKLIAKTQATRNPQVAGRFVGRFGWRGQVARLETFVHGACAVELGLSTSSSKQSPDPLHPADQESDTDLTTKECADLTAFIASLPRPRRLPPVDDAQATSIHAGEELFGTIGCAVCHLPTLREVTGIYSDLLVHDLGTRLEDPFAAPLTAAQEYYGSARPPKPSPLVEKLRREWKTPPLWGLRDSGPYLHDGRAGTIDEAVLWHGGQAASAVEKYQLLDASQRGSIIEFLSTLAAPDTAELARAVVSKP